MIWSDQQLARVRGTRQALVVDTLRARADVLECVRNELAHGLIGACRTHAVEVHPGDLAFSEAPDLFHPAYTRVVARWAPTTNVVELMGGPADGTVYAMERLGPIQVAVHRPMHLAAYTAPPTADPEVITPLVVTYERKTWNETERRWVFTVGGR